MKRNLLITTAAITLAAGTMVAAAQGVQQKQGPGGAGTATEPGAQDQMPQGKGKAQQPTTQGQGGGAVRDRNQEQGGQAQRNDGEREGAPSNSKSKQNQNQRNGQSQNDRNGQKGAESKGSGGGSGSAALTTEQRTKIRTTVLRGNNAPRVSKVNFQINVGTVVPTSVRVVAVPAVLIDIHPDWRGYMYFIVGERIIIIDDSHKIVAVMTV